MSLGYDTGVYRKYLGFTATETKPAGTSIDYQFSDSDDNINFSSWTSDFTSLTKRYFRFKITLNGTGSATPEVSNIDFNIVGSIELTGNVVSYTFNTATYLQALEKIVELCPAGWYFYVDANNIFHLKQKAAEADHVLVIGKHLSVVKPQKRIENVKNEVLFVGNGIYKRYVRSGSQSSYGRRVHVMQDNRVSQVGTADIMANTFLDNNESVEIRTKIRIIDSNSTNDNTGYNIESIKPGQLIRIEGFGTNYPETLFDVSLFDVASWDYSVSYANGIAMQVVNIRYQPDCVDVELSSRPIPVNRRIEDIYRNLKNYLNSNNGTTPDV
jgi:hypothetical protein